MIAILTLIASLDCTQPRVKFEPFFQAYTGYTLGKPHRFLSQADYVRDLAHYGGAFMDYVADYNAKCGSSK